MPPPHRPSLRTRPRLAPAVGFALPPSPLTLLALSLALLAGPLAPVAAAQAPPTSPADSARRARGDSLGRDSLGRDSSLALDSLRARLARAEAAIAVLREQVATESQSVVHTRSRIRVELSAQLLTNFFGTYGRVNNVDVPQVVLAPTGDPSLTPPTNDAVGFTLRQTRVGAAAAVDRVLGGTFSGDLDVDFFGGVQTAPGDRRLFPEPRLRTARARVTWRRTELMVGAETPLISDLNPVSLASVGTPDFSGAGNLWNWLGQARLTHVVATTGSGAHAVRWAVQGAVMSPFAGQFALGEPDAVDAGERARRPALEGRVSARWGESDDAGAIVDGLIGDRGGEIGVGAHQGWVADEPGPFETSHALSLDARAVLARGLELRGEWYVGQLLRGLGGGGIAQNYGRPDPAAPAGTLGQPLRDQAAWLQVNVQPHTTLLGGVGCGVDLVNPNDRPARLQNTVCAAHAEWRPVQPLVIGAEYRQIGTRYPAGTYGARHLNLIFGVEL